MPVLYFKFTEERAVQDGRIPQILLHRRRSGLRHARPGDTLRLFAVSKDVRRYRQRRIGVAICDAVHTLDVAPGLQQIDGKRATEEAIAALVNPGILDPGKHLGPGTDVAAWFNAVYGLPMQVETTWQPFHGELVQWGALTEVGEFDHLKGAV